jgi:2'-5' RNA ligase
MNEIYMIGFVLQGEAYKFHKELIEEISRKFGVEKPARTKIAPHITFKAPFMFNATQIELVETAVKNAIALTYSTNFTISGYGTFQNKVIYTNVIPTQTMKLFHEKLFEELKKIKGVEFKPDERLQQWEYHSTLATGIREEHTGKEILTYLNEEYPSPSFSQDFNALSILVYEGHHWKIHKTYDIRR